MTLQMLLHLRYIWSPLLCASHLTSTAPQLPQVRQGYVAYLKEKRKAYLIQCHPTLTTATEAFRAQLSALMQYQIRKTGTFLFFSGDVPDRAWLLVRGAVSLRARSGAVKTVEGPDWVGAGAIFTRNERRWSAEVVSDNTELLCLPSSSFNDFCQMVRTRLNPQFTTGEWRARDPSRRSRRFITHDAHAAACMLRP